MSEEKKVLKLSGGMIVMGAKPSVPEWVHLVEALLAVPEVRKAAANWATDELLAVREHIVEARAHE